MRRLLPLLASLVLLALPSAAHGYTFYEWDTAAPPRGILHRGDRADTRALRPARSAEHAERRADDGALIAGAARAPACSRAGHRGRDLWFIDDGDDKVGRIDPRRAARRC